MNILPLIRAVRETVSLTPPFPSHLFLMVWRKQAYPGVKYWIYSIRNSFGNNFCCDQSCRWCWTMLGKIKKRLFVQWYWIQAKHCQKPLEISQSRAILCVLYLISLNKQFWFNPFMWNRSAGDLYTFLPL